MSRSILKRNSEYKLKKFEYCASSEGDSASYIYYYHHSFQNKEYKTIVIINDTTSYIDGIINIGIQYDGFFILEMDFSMFNLNDLTFKEFYEQHKDEMINRIDCIDKSKTILMDRFVDLIDDSKIKRVLFNTDIF